MKVAICFSGQVRTWQYCHQNWADNLFHLGEVDYFCHFWDYNSIPAGCLRGYENIPADILLSEDEKQSIIDTLKPVQIEFESKKMWKYEGDDSWYSKRVTNPLMFGQCDQFYSLMKSANLKRQHELANNFEYDVVIRMRPDSIFVTTPVIENVEPNIVYNIHQSFDKQENRPKVADVYFHSDSFTFDQLSWFINDIQSIDNLDIVASTSNFTPEIAFYYYIKSIGVISARTDITPKVVVTPESMQKKGLLQGNEILTISI